MIQVSKNFNLGKPIFHLSEINELARSKSSIAYRFGTLGKFNVKPAAIIQNWSIRTALQYEFYTIEKINP
jgi:hypothetical protein